MGSYKKQLFEHVKKNLYSEEELLEEKKMINKLEGANFLEESVDDSHHPIKSNVLEEKESSGVEGHMGRFGDTTSESKADKKPQRYESIADKIISNKNDILNHEQLKGNEPESLVGTRNGFNTNEELTQRSNELLKRFFSEDDDYIKTLDDLIEEERRQNAAMGIEENEEQKTKGGVVGEPGNKKDAEKNMISPETSNTKETKAPQETQHAVRQTEETKKFDKKVVAEEPKDVIKESMDDDDDEFNDLIKEDLKLDELNEDFDESFNLDFIIEESDRLFDDDDEDGVVVVNDEDDEDYDDFEEDVNMLENKINDILNEKEEKDEEESKDEDKKEEKKSDNEDEKDEESKDEDKKEEKDEKEDIEEGTKRGVPDGTGPYGKGDGPGKGKADGSGLKNKNQPVEEKEKEKTFEKQVVERTKAKTSKDLVGMESEELNENEILKDFFGDDESIMKFLKN